MKSSEISTASTQNSSSKIQQDSDSLIGEVKQEIIVILDRIKELLKDNQAFLVILISKCLLIGKDLDKHIYWDDIDALLRHEYPDLLKNEQGKKLLKLTSLLCDELCLDKELINMNKLLKSFSEQEYNNLRNVLDDVVLEHLDINREDIGLIGGIFNYEA